MAEEFYHYNKQTKTKEIILFLKIPQMVQNDQPTTLLNAKMNNNNNNNSCNKKKPIYLQFMDKTPVCTVSPN